MKTAERRTARDVRFVIALFVSAICMAMLGSGIARANDLPLAWTEISGGPYVNRTQNAAGDGTAYSEGTDTGAGPQGPWEYSFAYNLIVNFNAIDLSVADYQSPNYTGPSPLNYLPVLGGFAGYTVSVEQISPFADGQPPSQVPVLVEAHAQGSVEAGLGGFFASVSVGGAQISYPPSPTVYGGPYTDSFNEQFIQWTTPGGQFPVVLSASIEAAPTSDSEVSVSIDPTITLDQAAFDIAYPNSGITLSDYYQIDYSDNLSPEPSTFTLLGIGLALAGYAGRRRKA